MNCIIIDDDNLSIKVLENHIEKTDFLKLVASFSNPIDAINEIGNLSPIDVMFLDIEMPDMNGIDLLKTLKTIPQIIIVSSKEQYALEAFEYDVTDYLLKPITYSRFFKAAKKVQSRLSQEKKEGISEEKEQIFIKNNTSIVRLSLNDILWIEALENYVVLNTYNEKYTIHFTMKAIINKLLTSKFSRLFQLVNHIVKN